MPAAAVQRRVPAALQSANAGRARQPAASLLLRCDAPLPTRLGEDRTRCSDTLRTAGRATAAARAPGPAHQFQAFASGAAAEQSEKGGCTAEAAGSTCRTSKSSPVVEAALSSTLCRLSIAFRFSRSLIVRDSAPSPAHSTACGAKPAQGKISVYFDEEPRNAHPLQRWPPRLDTRCLHHAPP